MAFLFLSCFQFFSNAVHILALPRHFCRTSFALNARLLQLCVGAIFNQLISSSNRFLLVREKQWQSSTLCYGSINSTSTCEHNLRTQYYYHIFSEQACISYPRLHEPDANRDYLTALKALTLGLLPFGRPTRVAVPRLRGVVVEILEHFLLKLSLKYSVPVLCFS